MFLSPSNLGGGFFCILPQNHYISSTVGFFIEKWLRMKPRFGGVFLCPNVKVLVLVWFFQNYAVLLHNQNRNMENKYRITITSHSGVESRAHLNRWTWTYGKAYDYFRLVSMEMGATEIPEKPSEPQSLQAEGRGYLIQLSV